MALNPSVLRVMNSVFPTMKAVIVVTGGWDVEDETSGPWRWIGYTRPGTRSSCESVTIEKAKLSGNQVHDLRKDGVIDSRVADANLGNFGMYE